MSSILLEPPSLRPKTALTEASMIASSASVTAPIRRPIFRLLPAQLVANRDSSGRWMGQRRRSAAAPVGTRQGDDADRAPHGVDRIDGKDEARASTALLAAGRCSRSTQ